MMDLDDVRSAVREDRVRPSERYHAWEHGFDFEVVRALLERVHLVAQDRRRTKNRGLRHPHGFVAWARAHDGPLVRIDFDWIVEEGQGWIEVVTAFEQ